MESHPENSLHRSQAPNIFIFITNAILVLLGSQAQGALILALAEAFVPVPARKHHARDAAARQSLARTKFQ